MLIPLRYPLAALVWSVVLPLRPIFLCYPVPSDRNNSSSFPRNASQRAAEFSPSLLSLPHGSLHAAQGRSVRGFNSRKTDRRRAGLSTGFRTDDPDSPRHHLGGDPGNMAPSIVRFFGHPAPSSFGNRWHHNYRLSEHLSFTTYLWEFAAASLGLHKLGGSSSNSDRSWRIG